MTRIGSLIDSAMDELINEIKESIGLPFQIDPLPTTFAIKTPYISLSTFDI